MADDAERAAKAARAKAMVSYAFGRFVVLGMWAEAKMDSSRSGSSRKRGRGRGREYHPRRPPHLVQHRDMAEVVLVPLISTTVTRRRRMRRCSLVVGQMTTGRALWILESLACTFLRCF
jgi:hypothetical protein